MKAKINAIYSADVEIELYKPENNDFCIELTVEIGEIGSDKTSNFSTQVCGDAFIENRLNEGEVFTLEKSIIMRKYSYIQLKNYIEGILFVANKSNPRSWKELASYLSKVGNWEFDKYRDL